jgi:hypothetical protein
LIFSRPSLFTAFSDPCSIARSKTSSGNGPGGTEAVVGVLYDKESSAHQGYAQGQISAANAGAGQATAGVNRGTSVTIGGINQAAALERQANKVSFDGSVKAATQARDSAFEAARLRTLASVISAVGHNVACDAEYGLTLRY